MFVSCKFDLNGKNYLSIENFERLQRRTNDDYRTNRMRLHRSGTSVPALSSFRRTYLPRKKLARINSAGAPFSESCSTIRRFVTRRTISSRLARRNLSLAGAVSSRTMPFEAGALDSYRTAILRDMSAVATPNVPDLEDAGFAARSRPGTENIDYLGIFSFNIQCALMKIH